MGEILQKQRFLQTASVFLSTRQTLAVLFHMQVLWCPDTDWAQVDASQEGELSVFVQCWRGYVRWLPPLLTHNPLSILPSCRYSVQQKSQSGEETLHLSTNSLELTSLRTTHYAPCIRYIVVLIIIKVEMLRWLVLFIVNIALTKGMILRWHFSLFNIYS